MTEAIQIGVRAIKENKISVEEVELCLEELDESINSQKQVENALGIYVFLFIILFYIFVSSKKCHLVFVKLLYCVECLDSISVVRNAKWFSLSSCTVS